MVVLSASVFRATRNADVVRNEETAEDLLEMMSDEVKERRFAPFVRLEVEARTPPQLVLRLQAETALFPRNVFSVKAGPIGCGDLDSLPVSFGMDQSLLYSHWAPATHPRLMNVKKKVRTITRPSCFFLSHFPFFFFFLFFFPPADVRRRHARRVHLLGHPAG